MMMMMIVMDSCGGIGICWRFRCCCGSSGGVGDGIVGWW